MLFIVNYASNIFTSNGEPEIISALQAGKKEAVHVQKDYGSKGKIKRPCHGDTGHDLRNPG
jgi:hypothetical protein